jgi:hypothetical protein
VAITVEFGSDLLVGGAVGLSGAQDDAAAEDQRLGRGAGADEGLQLLLNFSRENQAGAERHWHGTPPCDRRDHE